MPEFDEYIKEIKELWDNHWLTNMGDKHHKLERELVRYLGVPNVTLFVNGHLALESAIFALRLKGEVITTPFTFASTTHAMVRSGLTPVFCDIDPDTYTIDVNKLESLITDKTSAIIPVHVYGNVCDINGIAVIAKKYNLKIIYDAAHAFGVTINGRGIATYGDASIFSFHATKVFNTIEGGAVAYENEDLKTPLDLVKNFGITGPESIVDIGGNAKMNEFQAAMGLCNLRHIDREISKRKAVVERYNERLTGIKGIKLAQLQKGVQSNYAYLPVLFDGFRYNRDRLFEVLKSENIIARKYFYPLTNSFKCYKVKYKCEETPIAQYIADRILTLPLYSDLALKDVDRICEVILKN